MAAFAVLGDRGIGKSSLLHKLAATSSDSRMLPVSLSVKEGVTDCMKFAEAPCAFALRQDATISPASAVSPSRPSVSITNASCSHSSFEETLEYTQAAFAGADLDSQNLAEWLFGKMLGHPYFLAFISREPWGHYRARPFTSAAPILPAVFRRLEQIKFTADLDQLSEKELALLQAIAADDQNEFNPAPFVQQFHYQYFKRLAEAGLLIRTRQGRYRLFHTLFREFLRQTQ